MDTDLKRVEADLQVMRSAIDGINAAPDAATPHLLLAAAGPVSVLAAWALETLGSNRFPLAAALAIALPPLAALFCWGRIKQRDPRFAQQAIRQPRPWREFSWQLLGTALLLAVLMLCGLSLISPPVILTLLAVLAAGLLQRPIMEHRAWSSIGWCVAIAVLSAALLSKWPVPGPRGAIAGYVLMLGGTLAAAIAAWSRKTAAHRSPA
jgi:hypothetical protein